MTKRILVVEDHEDNRRIIRDLLRATGYEMVEAHDGEAALERWRRSGSTLSSWTSSCRASTATRWRGGSGLDPANGATPIIAVTSYALSGDEEKTRHAGCNAYVSKPYRPRELARRRSTRT